jgi:hypothetical protein
MQKKLIGFDLTGNTLVLCNAFNDFTLFLPDVRSMSPSCSFKIVKTDADGTTLTIAAIQGQQISGVSDIYLEAQYDSVTISFDQATGWYADFSYIGSGSGPYAPLSHVGAGGLSNHPAATALLSGFMADTDKVNLDALVAYKAARATATGEETGFESPTLVTRSYDSATRKFTFTQLGGVVVWYKSTRTVLASPWVSDAHGTDLGMWFLSIKSVGVYTWTQTPWPFESEAMMGLANYTAADKFGVSENHGLLQWQSHEELHDLLGTYRVSGLLPTAGTYTLQTATDAANSPGFDVGIIKDEDLLTTIPAWTQGAYTTLRLVGAGATATFDKTATLMTRVGTTYPKRNRLSGGVWGEVEMANGDIFNVYQLLIPVTSDAESQAYRCVIVQPQATFATVAAAQAEDPRGVNLGTLSSMTAEFCFFTRFTFQCRSSYGGATGQCRIEALSYVTGSRASQVSVSGVTPLNHNDLSGRDAVDAHILASITSGGVGYIPFGDATLSGHTFDAAFKYVSSALYVPKLFIADGGYAPSGLNYSIEVNLDNAIAGVRSMIRNRNSAQYVSFSLMNEDATQNATFGRIGSTFSATQGMKSRKSAVFYNSTGNTNMGSVDGSVGIFVGNIDLDSSRRVLVTTTGVTLSSLAGTGSRMVVAGSTGLLSATVLPWRGSNLASPPSSPADGQFYSDTSRVVYVYENTAWTPLNGPPLFA